MWRRNQLLADIHHEVELTREEVRLSRESRDDLRDFLRETTVRVDRSLARFERSLADSFTRSGKAVTNNGRRHRPCSN